MATPTSLPATFVAGNVLTAAQMNDLRGAFRILQVVSTTKTDTFTTASTSYTDVTDLTVTITPTASTSKILVIASVMVGTNAGGNSPFVTIADGSDNNLVVPTSPSSRVPSFFLFYANSGSVMLPSTFVLLHSPATTSAFTYKVRARTNSAPQIAYINRSGTDTDNASYARGVSTLTVMEVSS